MTAEMPEKLQRSPARGMWEHFFALSAIPRPSGGEEPVRRHIEKLAASRGWEAQSDRTGNIVARVPGRGSLAAEEPLILQGHMDMVCEKVPGLDHDFTRDPLKITCEEGWLRAAGTTLGADNGIGMAMALSVAESALPDRVPLELLFTVDEETGLTGAMELDTALLKGRSLINLDSEEEGVIIVGCAGGLDMQACFDCEQDGSAEPGPVVRCVIGGLRGGHSGINIHEGRANAILFTAEMMERMHSRRSGARIHRWKGGTRKNVIPRDAEFVVSGITCEEAEEVVAAVIEESRQKEPMATFEVEAAEAAERSVVPWAAVGFTRTIPNGVIAMDPDLGDLVHTSSNLGVLRSDGDQLRMTINLRSADDARSDAEAGRIAAAARSRDGRTETGGSYPGWKPNPESRLVRHVQEVCTALSGRPARIRGIHAGLEAGVIGALIGTGELLSLGPDIENAHSPGERLSIASAERVCRLLERVVGTKMEVSEHPS